MTTKRLFLLRGRKPHYSLREYQEETKAPRPDGNTIRTIDENQQFTSEYEYICPKCGKEVEGGERYKSQGTYNKKTDSITCPNCSTDLKVGDGTRDSDSKHPGDLDVLYFFVCPRCGHRTTEDDLERFTDKDDEQFEGDNNGPLVGCPHCGLITTHEGCCG